MKWTQLKKRIEGTFADSVRGHVEIWTTRYRKSHDEEGEAWITIDKERVSSIGTYTYLLEVCREADRLCRERHRNEQNSGRYYSEALQVVLEKNVVMPLWDVNSALFDYLNMSMNAIMASDHPVIRAIGMLDKRMGKRRLKTVHVEKEHPLVKLLYEFRCRVEGIKKEC